MAECDVGVRAPPPAAPVRQRPDAGPHAPRLHRASATSSGSRRRAPPSPTSRSPPTSSSGSPARPTTTSSARSRSSTQPRYDAAYTFVFSPRPGHRRGRDGRRVRRRPRSSSERMHRLTDVVERHALGRARGAGRADRGGARRGPVEEGPDRARRAGPGRTSSSTSPPTAAARSGGTFVEVRDHRRRAALAARASWSSVTAPTPGRASASRSRRSDATATPPRPRRADRVGQVGARARRRATRSATSRSSRSTRCRCTGASTSAPRSRRRPSGPRSRTTWSTSPTRTRTGRSRAFQAAARAAIADIEAPRPPGAARRRHRPLRAGGRRRPPLPGRGPRAAGRARGVDAPSPAASPPRTPSSTAADPVAAARIEPHNARRIVRALEVDPAHRPAVLVVRARRRRVRADRVPGRDRRRLAAARRRSPRRIAARVAAMRDAGLVDEVRRLARGPGRLSRTAAPGDRVQGGPRPRSRDASPTLDAALTQCRPPHPARSPAASACGSAGIPASPGSAPAENPLRGSCPPSWQRGVADDDRPPLQAPRHRQRLPRARRTSTARAAARLPRPSPRSATATAASAPTGCIALLPGRRRRRLHDGAAATPTAAWPR